VYGQFGGVSQDPIFYLWDGTAWTASGIDLPSTWGWANVVVTSILDTWGKIDGAQMYVYSGNTVTRTDVDCAYLYVEYSVSDTDPPQFPDYTGTTNNSDVACWTAIIANFSITDANPDTYIYYSNTTGSNESKTSGTYVSGNYYSWQFDNDNTSLVGSTIFIQIWANDTIPNWNSSIVYVSITSYFTLNIVETEFNWTSPNVVKGSGVWVYIDIPSEQFLNLSLKGAPNWEIRGYYNRTEAELHVKGYITDSTGGTMPESEDWWDSGGTEFTDSEQVISGGDNQPAGDYTASGDNYCLWLVIQVDQAGVSSYGMSLTLLIYQNV